MRKSVYFDNSATTIIKPPCVITAVNSCISHFCANPGRASHKLSVVAARGVWWAREQVASLVGNRDASRIIFTSGCTEALNLAIFGAIPVKSQVVTTVTEHNSVLRSLRLREKRGEIKCVFAPLDGGKITKRSILPHITNQTSTVVVSAVSNVTGAINDIAEIGALCREKGLIFIVDGAQAVGHIGIDMQKTGVDLLAIAPHKGLHALPGVGALAVSDRACLSPIRFGGTGSHSFNLSQPSGYPDGFEAGTVNLPGIMAFGRAAKEYNARREEFEGRVKALSRKLYEGLLDLQKDGRIKLYSSDSGLGIAAFSVRGSDSVTVADLLSERFGICVRGGLHCAPLMHGALGTTDTGLVRVSLSRYNTEAEIEYFVNALRI